MIRNGWYHCEHCGQKLFPVNSQTVVRHLEIKCKGKFCRKICKINIEPEPLSRAPKPIQN